MTLGNEDRSPLEDFWSIGKPETKYQLEDEKQKRRSTADYDMRNKKVYEPSYEKQKRRSTADYDMRNKKDMTDWCSLPDGVIALVARSLKVVEDFIAFRATCTTWRKATSLKDFDKSCLRLPLLMCYRFVFEEKEVGECKFLSLARRKTFEISLPEAKGMRCRGSKGWLIMVEPFKGDMCLLHPLTCVQIPLPKAPDHGDLDLPRGFACAALSASPSETSDYVVMVHHDASDDPDLRSGSYLGFWKPGNLSWTRVENPSYSVEDLIYYNGKFYALTCHAEVWVFDLSGPNANKIMELSWKYSRPHAQLVECVGRLLIVAPFYRCDYDTPLCYDLEMVELDVMKGSYTIITSLGSSSVFLGNNEGFSIDANSFSGILVPNSIYFSSGSYQVAIVGPECIGNGVWLNF